jgi:membrane glycosyltransferase
MSPMSMPVLGGAALVSSPALWSSLVTGETAVTLGLTRYVIAVLLCWVGLSFVSALVGPVPTVGQPSAPRDEASSPESDR